MRRTISRCFSPEIQMFLGGRAHEKIRLRSSNFINYTVSFRPETKSHRVAGLDMRALEWGRWWQHKR